MKKNEMRKMALIGLSTGLLISSGLSAITLDKEKVGKAADPKDANDGNVGYHLMTEDELLLELNSDGTALYKSLDPKGKELARFVASMHCNGSNACKGLNACQTDKNDCAGKGACKGKGKCAISDKNLAVKLVAEKQKMENKRSQALTK